MYRSVIASRITLPWALIIAATLIGSQCESGASLPRWKICGNRLSSIAIMVCKAHGGLYEPREGRSLERGGGFERRIRRSEDGIVQECCRKACSYDQMLQYCAEPPPPEATNPDDIDRILGRTSYPDTRNGGEDSQIQPRVGNIRVGTYARVNPSGNMDRVVFLDGEEN